MKIVILGYTGFIGQNILKNLSKNNNFNLICVGRNIIKKPIQSKKIKYYKWDFISFKKSNLFFLKKANIIINCVGKTHNNGESLKKINVTFIKNLLKYIRSDHEKVRFIHLSSVSVYGADQEYINENKIIKENTATKAISVYSKSKLSGELLIKNEVKKKINRNFSFTILRITNVFGNKKKSNLYNFVLFSLILRFWIKCSNQIMYNFINVKDISQSVRLTISKLKVSKNKTYIVSDDCKQFQLNYYYQKFYKKKIITISLPII